MTEKVAASRCVPPLITDKEFLPTHEYIAMRSLSIGLTSFDAINRNMALIDHYYSLVVNGEKLRYFEMLPQQVAAAYKRRHTPTRDVMRAQPPGLA